MAPQSRKIQERLSQIGRLPGQRLFSMLGAAVLLQQQPGGRSKTLRDGFPENEKTTMQKYEREIRLTVQGTNNPVPAAERSDQAGSRSSISSDCNATPVRLAEVADNATGKNNTSNNSTNGAIRKVTTAINPFGRSAVVRRSPPRVIFSTPVGGETDESVVNTSPPNANTGNLGKQDAFTKLGELIVNLMDFMKTKNNIHHTIKEQVCTIRSTYNRAREEMGKGENLPSPKPLEKLEKVTQTTPQMATATEKSGKRSRDLTSESPRKDTPKRYKRPTPKRLELKNKEDKPQQRPMKDDNVQWQTVQRKKKKERKKSHRPDAMIISAKGETTYADILRKMKADPGLQDMGKNVSGIRRTHKGDLLLEIRTNDRELVDRFHEKIEKTMGQEVSIKTRRNEVLVECRNLDEVTTKEEICLAFANERGIDSIKQTNIVSLRKGFNGTQVATMLIPLDTAQSVLKNPKIRIGWVVCHLRPRVPIKRCFRCLEFGHIAMRCTSTRDRSKKCRRCGEEGHIARDCRKDPLCMFCQDRGKTENGHIAGSRRCPVFMEALKNTRK